MHLHVSLLAVIFPALLVVTLSPENVLAGGKKHVVAGNKPVLAGNKPVQTGQSSNTNAKPQAVFTPNNKRQNLKPSAKQRKDIDTIINRLDSKCLRENAKSCVDTEGKIRLDMQGGVNRDNIRCCNIQIQDKDRKSGQSSSFVVVVVPLDSNIQDVQEAMRKSLKDGVPYDLYYK